MSVFNSLQVPKILHSDMCRTANNFVTTLEMFWAEEGCRVSLYESRKKEHASKSV